LNIKEGSLEDLVFKLLNISLETNEYRKNNSMIETDEYIKLLDLTLDIAQKFSEYENNVNNAFSEINELNNKRLVRR
jgi:hypothetical protein